MPFFLFLLGLAFGSFLNVLTLRYKPDESYGIKTVGGRSHCLHCGRQLRWFELIPVLSFVMQRGACRACGKKLSWQYPLVELAAGLIFVTVPLFFQQHALLWGISQQSIPLVLFSALWIGIFLLLLAMYIIDMRWYVIPNILNGALAIAGVCWIVLEEVFHVSASIGGGSFLGNFSQLFPLAGNMLYVNHLWGAVIGGLFFLAVVLISRGKGMGMGDVKLIAALGLLFGWPDVGLIIALSFIIGTVVMLPLMAVSKKHLSDKVPFGPFIVVAAAVAFFFGSGILSSYFAIIQKIGGM